MNTEGTPVSRDLESYLLRLRWNLGALPSADRDEIVAEIRSHFHDRSTGPDGRDAYAVVVREFGEPEVYAGRFLENYQITSALASGSPWAMFSQVLRVLGKGTWGFVGGLGLFIGYAFSVGFVAVAALKPIVPDRVGFWIGSDTVTIGYLDPIPEGTREVLGPWIVPVALVAGLLLFVLTNLLARRFLRSFRKPVAMPGGRER